MAIPLIALAIGSVFAGYLGVPHALGGGNRIEQFLQPSFHASALAGHAAVGASREMEARIVLLSAEEAAQAASEEHALEATELTLMAISSGIAFAGIGIAFYFWRRNPAAADAMAERFRPIHVLLNNKYYVDELYDAVVVQPIKLLSTSVLWRAADAGFIDGAVNGVGVAVRGSSTALRRLQTGSVRTYAAAIFAGVVLIVGYYLAG